jgi:kynurenine formamidase
MKKTVLAAALVLAGSVVFAGCGKKATGQPLWDQLSDLKSNYQWVDLSWELSPETPHWWGFDPLRVVEKYTFAQTLKDFGNNPHNSFAAFLYTLPGQYGTHVDFPAHFDPKGKTADKYGPGELAYQLVVLDKSAAVAKNPDYILTKQDVLDFEARYGAIPEGAFVAFRSDWSKRPLNDFEAKDANGDSHYPGWDINALEYLITVRKAAAIGHETPDTDAAITGNSDVGMIGEDYILDRGKLNVELLKNLDKLPSTGAIVFVTFPILKDGVGFTSRVFAIAPK